MEDDHLDGSPQTVLTCSKKDYLNSLISGDLDESSPYLSDSSEEETERYINHIMNRLEGLDKDIWFSIEVIQNNACKSLGELKDLLRTIPDRDVEFKKLVNPLQRVEDLTVSIERKYEKTYKLRQLRNLKTLLLSNQKVLSLIYNWDDNIRSIQSIISSYLSHKENLNSAKDSNLINKDSFNPFTNHDGRVRYVVLGEEGFSLSDLDKLKSILSQLKGDYDTCLNNMINTNIPQTLGIIMDKYYVILEDLTLDVIHYALTSHNFFNPNNWDSYKSETDMDADQQKEELKMDQQLELTVMGRMQKYAKYYVFERENTTNLGIVNRHLKNKLEDILMNHLKYLSNSMGFDLFTRYKEGLDLVSNLDKVKSILESFLHYFLVLFTTFKKSFYDINKTMLEYNQDKEFEENTEESNNNEGVDQSDRVVRSLSEQKEWEEGQLEDLFRKLVLNILTSSLLNSNVFYLVSTLRDEDLYMSLNTILVTLEDSFGKYSNYFSHLNIDSQIEYMNFIPFDVLDQYTRLIHTKSKLFNVQTQPTFNDLFDSTNMLKHLVNRLGHFHQSLNGSKDASSQETTKGNQDEGDNLLRWLYIYCILNESYLEFDGICQETVTFSSNYFSGLAPRVEINPINISFELKCRDFLLQLLLIQKELASTVESLLSLACVTLSDDCSLNPNVSGNFSVDCKNKRNKISKNIWNCLKEKHDWSLASQLQPPFRDVVFSTKSHSDLLKEFEMANLFFSVSQHLSRHLSNNVSYLFHFYYQPLTSSSNLIDNDSVNIYIELIGEYYINLLPTYCDNTETFKVLQKSLEMFMDSEFESLANLKTKVSNSSYRKNIEYLIKISKLLNVSTSDSLLMLLN